MRKRIAFVGGSGAFQPEIAYTKSKAFGYFWLQKYHEKQTCRLLLIAVLVGDR
jgi:hypothetical protein